MTPNLKSKIVTLASQSEIARRLGIKPQTVNLWFKNGVPAQKVLSLCECLSWKITPHEVAPEIYPNIADGLPDRGELSQLAS
ncbi:TPA: helix-turn-helix domain-containing protein [Morganella morganii subsp. morganii]|nr:helix-turn-helix domain-containing protein [Morganella morganii]HDS3815403.1 helix-turn-helix domain-containing protein [Morganella morganii subsp. morganii]HDS7364277.1 helix-turn-helix domain-containing protein [Morganella morganii subsp. morganii]